MNKRGKAWHFVAVAFLIILFSLSALLGFSYQYGDIKTTYIKGAQDIRFGIDIRGGVDVTFMPADDMDATDEQMVAARTVIEDRLVGLGITDYEDYVDYTRDRIIVRFPWKRDETDFDPQSAIDEIGTTAHMVFRKGSTADGEEILTGEDVESAMAGYDQTEGYVVQLDFNDSGAQKFADATTKLAPDSGTISIWLDDENISTATVEAAITNGSAIIRGDFTQEEVTTLANQINSGALPFALSAEKLFHHQPHAGHPQPGSDGAGRCDRFCGGRAYHDPALPAARHHCGAVAAGPGCGHACRRVRLLPGIFRFYADAARHRGYHSGHRYGRGRQCYHGRAYP